MKKFLIAPYSTCSFKFILLRSKSYLSELRYSLWVYVADGLMCIVLEGVHQIERCQYIQQQWYTQVCDLTHCNNTVHSIIVHFIEITTLLIHSFLIHVSMVTAVLETYVNTLHGNDMPLLSAVADWHLRNCTVLGEVPNDALGNSLCIARNTMSLRLWTVWEVTGKECSWPNRHIILIFACSCSRRQRTFCHDCDCEGRDSDPSPLKCKIWTLLLSS